MRPQFRGPRRLKRRRVVLNYIIVDKRTRYYDHIKTLVEEGSTKPRIKPANGRAQWAISTYKPPCGGANAAVYEYYTSPSRRIRNSDTKRLRCEVMAC